MNKIEQYFEACVDFWMSHGDSRDVATVKALWWDCVEVWNADKSWTKEKIEFVNRWRQYEPYCEVPPSSCVEVGNA